MSDLKLVIALKDGTEVYNSDFVMELNKEHTPAVALDLFASMQLLLLEASGEVTQIMQDVVDEALENSEEVEAFIGWIKEGKPSASGLIQCGSNLGEAAITTVNIQE
ncbi:hypothetical protein [Maridesulfovibrio sp.]|uniref:hypothetical protein n=1 Tax=Maridesulfovibrio sp. TaxID=2795000 RepID=UPI002A18D8BA|nr:hypothetical protein [Maridesulfovibrio sp.]